MYDNIFDLSYMHKTSHYERLEGFTNEIKRICELPINEIQKLYIDNLETIEYNYNNLTKKNDYKLPNLMSLLLISSNGFLSVALSFIPLFSNEIMTSDKNFFCLSVKTISLLIENLLMALYKGSFKLRVLP